MKQRIETAKQNHGVYFIVELGQNHQGSIDIAKQMIDSLVGTGVAAVKTAKRDIEVEAWKRQPYENKNSFGATYYEHRKALELSKDDFWELKRYAESKGFDFISSFTDLNSLDFLNEIGVRWLKIASSRVTDIPLLKAAAATKKPIILSTGMSTIPEIFKALRIFAENETYLLQCTASYPCNESDLNLNVINTYKEIFCKCAGYGFSGHHAGIAPDIAAYCMGIDILERHYTLNRSWKGTDHAASLTLDGIKYIMKYIKQIKAAMGSYDKRVLECEQYSLKKLRKL